MPLVTGILRTFSFAVLPSTSPLSPEVWFVPKGPAVAGTSLFVSQPIQATLDQFGSWSAELISYENTRPAVSYLPQMRWLDPAGNYMSADFPDWELFVPLEGGFFVDLVSTEPNPLIVWWAPTEPVGTRKQVIWVNTDTGDVKEWS